MFFKRKYLHVLFVFILIFSLGVSGLNVNVNVSADTNDFDTIIRNGTIVDGSGLDRYDADVAIKDGYIAKIGDLSEDTAAEEIDASGQFVAPGFIDVHSHAEVAALQEARSPLSQGVTLEVLNPDGGGPTDVLDRFNLESSGLGINIAAYIGFNSVWAEVVGNEDRRATDDEVQEMRDLVTKAMNEGAAGVSAGLFYRPAYFADTDQVIEVVNAAEDWRTKFTNHQRNENDQVLEATAETIEIGEGAGLSPVVTHIKAMGPNNWGKSKEMMDMINAAHERGVYAAADIYPYLRSQTGLTAIVPPWVEDGGRAAMLERFADPELRDSIAKEIEEIVYSRVQGPEGIYFPTKRRTLADYMERGLEDKRNRSFFAFLNLDYDQEFDVDVEEIHVKNANGDIVYEYDFEGNDGAEWDDTKFDELHSYPSNALTYSIQDNAGHVNVAQRAQGNASAYGKVTPAMQDVGDSETFMRFRVGDTMGADHVIRFWVNSDNFGSGSSFPVNGHGLAVRLDQDRIQVQTRENSSTTTHETITDAGITPNTWLDLKVKVEDDTLYTKMWPADEAEPEEWASTVDISKEDDGNEEERELTIGETTMQILETEGSLRTIYDFGHEDDFKRFIQSPVVAIGSDGGATTSASIHPRRYGTQPRVLGVYVREEGLISWEEAVLKMTSLPAAMIGLSDRGYIAVGMKADITIFDPETVVDNATFDEPQQYADGIEHVIVNGQSAITNGEMTNTQAGEAVRIESNMPTRPLTRDEHVEVSANNTIASLEETNEATDAFISFDLEQGATDVKATGTLEIVDENNSIDLVAEEFGRVQLFDGWQSFTGTGTLNGEELAMFRVTIDENDPTIDDDRPVLTLDIVGEEQIKVFLGESLSEEVDTTDLQAKVDEVKDLNESDYTAESWEAFANVLAAAESVLADEDATQEEVNAALADLIAAHTGLVPVEEEEPANKTDLQAKVDEVKDLNESDYTAESWGAFADALAAAESVLADEDATQVEVDAALADLIAAHAGLVPVVEEEPADKTALQAKVDEVKGLNASDYTEESWSIFADALKEAESVLADEDATQIEVNTALAILIVAHAGLIPVGEEEPVNKTDLQAKVDEVKGLKASDYTAGSWGIFADALEEAESVLADEAATQVEVDTALIALIVAHAGLVPVEEGKPADKTDLQAKVDEVKGLKASDYTTESWGAFALALQTAKSVLADEDATQIEVDKALADLITAWKALEKKSSSPGDGKDPGKDDDKGQKPGDKDGDKDKDGSKLPSTATSYFNWMLIGFALIVLAGVVWQLNRRRRA